MIQLQAAVAEAAAAMKEPKGVAECGKILQSRAIPLSEKEFKRVFDEYSEAITYKQRYMDQ